MIGAGLVRPDEFPNSSSMSAVRLDNCQLCCGGGKGVNSIGNENTLLFVWAMLTLIVASTSDGFLFDHAMLFAVKVIGR